MKDENTLPYIELPATPAKRAHADAVLPSACESGGCGCGSQPGPAPAPMPAFAPVSVNGATIAPDRIAREMQHHPAERGETAWHEAARALAIKELLLQESTRRGIEAQVEDTGTGRTETTDDARVRILLEGTLPQASVSEAECQRYYQGNVHRFRTPDLFEAAHILIEPSEKTENGWREAERQARALAAELGNNEQRFAEAARQISSCPTATQDGALGQVRAGELAPPLHRALEALPEGRTASEPVKSRFGWHVIRMQRRIGGHTLPFEHAREKILDMLEARAWVNAASRYILELASDASIEGVDLSPQIPEPERTPHE